MSELLAFPMDVHHVARVQTECIDVLQDNCS